MAEPNQKPQSEQKNDPQRAAVPQVAATPLLGPQAEQREYTVKHKITTGGRSKRRQISRGETMRLTDDEAKHLGDAVELKR